MVVCHEVRAILSLRARRNDTQHGEREAQVYATNRHKRQRDGQRAGEAALVGRGNLGQRERTNSNRGESNAALADTLRWSMAWPMSQVAGCTDRHPRWAFLCSRIVGSRLHARARTPLAKAGNRYHAGSRRLAVVIRA